MRPLLADTLVELVSAFLPPPGSGLEVTYAELEAPFEVTVACSRDGLVFRAAPPYTRWVSGVQPTVHRARLRIEPVNTGVVASHAD